MRPLVCSITVSDVDGKVVNGAAEVPRLAALRKISMLWVKQAAEYRKFTCCVTIKSELYKCFFSSSKACVLDTIYHTMNHTMVVNEIRDRDREQSGKFHIQTKGV